MPGKNLRVLAGRPLLAYTADAIREAGLAASPCLLTTDDDGIAEVGRGLGWLAPFRRPAHLAGDDATTADAVIHALDWFAAEDGADPKAVMVLQPTSPLRGGAVLRCGLDVLAARPEANSVIAVSPLHVSASHTFCIDECDMLRPVGADDRRVVVPNGALYLTRTAALRSRRSLYAPPIAPIMLDAERAIDIDTESDLRVAEVLLAAAGALPQ
ncbi:MAG: acylneuraminate cytidylyltransferase family protein [Rhodospirillales bacterium]|nr:acylneuraminate cytidylyltransferase family protein [Rhodospirillales bacterium]